MLKKGRTLNVAPNPTKGHNRSFHQILSENPPKTTATPYRTSLLWHNYFTHPAIKGKPSTQKSSVKRKKPDSLFTKESINSVATKIDSALPQASFIRNPHLPTMPKPSLPIDFQPGPFAVICGKGKQCFNHGRYFHSDWPKECLPFLLWETYFLTNRLASLKQWETSAFDIFARCTKPSTKTPETELKSLL